MSDAEIAQAKDIARVLSSAHVGGYNVIANAETLELLEPVVGDPDMVYAVTRHLAALSAVLAEWLTHELGRPSTISAVDIIEDVLFDLEVSAKPA